MVTVTGLISLKSQSVIKTMVFYCYLLQTTGCAQQLPKVHRSCTIEVANSGVLVTTDTSKDLSYHFVSRESGRERGIGCGASSNVL